MNINHLEKNIIQWAAERGIYEHSTIEAQALKAVSEMGELADAVIKSDSDGVKDAVGDVIVCLVNVAHLSGGSVSEWCETVLAPGNQFAEPSELLNLTLAASCILGSVCDGVLSGLRDDVAENTKTLVILLEQIALCHGFTLQECINAAWLEIKDRRGKMVPGGAFVKD